MDYLIVLAFGFAFGVTFRELPAAWRRVRRAQAAHKPEYDGGLWFADATPDPASSQAQIGDAPVMGKISFRSRPARHAVRRNGR